MAHIDLTNVHVGRRIKCADRQATYRQRMEALGMVQVSGWVHRTQAPEVVGLMQNLRINADLTVGPIRNTRTGKLQKLVL